MSGRTLIGVTRGLAFAVAAVVAVASLLTGTVPAQAAVPAPTVEILSPAPDAVVEGKLNVEIFVTADPSLGINTATVTLSTRRVTVFLPWGGCGAGCRASAVIDTLAPAGHVSSWTYVVPDGPAVLTASVATMGAGAAAQRNVVIDNKRPVVTVAAPLRGTVSPTSLFPHSADGELRLEASAAVPAGSGSEVVSMTMTRQWELRDPFIAPTAAGRPWTLSLDTSALVEGTRSEFVVAVDGRGVTSVPVRVGYVVSHGFTLTGPSLPPDVRDVDLSHLQLHYSYPSVLPDTRLATVTTFLDGAKITAADPCCAPLSQSGVLSVGLGKVPPGEHVLTFVVTDTRGSERRIDLPVNVSQTLFATWTSGAGGRVTAGSPLRMSASARSTAVGLSSWHATIDGYNVPRSGQTWDCAVSCPGEVTLSFDVTHLAPGRHVVELTVEAYRSWQQKLSTVITVDPYLPPTPLIGPGNWTGQAGNDVLSRRPGGVLWLQQGQADGTLDTGWQIGKGWGSFSAIVGPGDWNGDRRPDLIGRDAYGGLWLYPGNGRSGFLSRTKIGTGWGSFRDILGPGDWNGDRKADLLGRDRYGKLWLYPGNGSGGFGTPRQIGTGWSGFNAVLGPGDMNGDGKPDLYARDGAGTLWLYPGNGTGGFRPRKIASSNWY